MEHLEIGTLTLNRRRELSLPNLRVFCVQSFTGNHIILDLPRLSKLYISGPYHFIHVLRPATVTHLGLGGLFSYQLEQYVQKFQECEYLYFRDFKLFDDHHIFNCFPKLKEIHCYIFSKKELLDLIKQRKVSRMLNVRIYFNGFSANEQDEVEELFDNGDHFVLTTQRIVNNYYRLPRVIRMYVELDYNQLIHHFDSRLPSDLHTKLGDSIRKLLIIGNVNDQASLLRFIEKFLPPILVIKFTSLNQTSFFYENLDSYWSHRLGSLRIEEQPGVITSLDFLTKLNYLSEFSTNQQIPCELIERLFEKFQAMKLEFRLNDQPITIVFNNNYFSKPKFLIQISDQKNTYTKDTFLNGVRQAFGLPLD